MNNQCLRALAVLRNAERGEDSSFEFTAGIFPLFMMILIIAFVTIVRSSQMPAWSAASECARAAVASRDPSLGDAQARRAAVSSLEGNNISATSAQINISGSWTPGTNVTCRVAYDIDVSGIVGFAELTGGKVPMSVSVSLRVEPYKSVWQ
jgi:Flp pilus assembly protein TadG